MIVRQLLLIVLVAALGSAALAQSTAPQGRPMITLVQLEDMFQNMRAKTTNTDEFERSE